MKWAFAIAVCALVAASAAAGLYWKRNSVRSEYVNGLAPYNHLRGSAFIVEQECYIFEFKSDEATYPLLGSNPTVPDLPIEVKESNVGAEFPKVRILGVIHTGDGFRIASIRKDTSREGSVISYEVVLDNESTRKYFKLDAYWIMDHSPEKRGEAPVFLSSYAVPRVME